MHIETVTSRPEELKSIISVEEKLWKVDSPPKQYAPLKPKTRRVPTMPKRYLPYQLDTGRATTKAVKIKQEEEVVCKSVGSNGLVFVASSSSDEAETEDDVDVETCGGEDSSDNLLDGDRKTVVTLDNNQEKEPSRRKAVLSPETSKEGGCSPPTPASHANTMAFVAILLHALKCSSCEKPACRKMIMVLQHYKHCALKRKVSLSEGSTTGQNCKICAQLLRIVALHSKNDCKMPPTQLGCPVLMCDTFRMASYANKVKPIQPNVKKTVKHNMRGANTTMGRRVVVTQHN